VLLEENSRGEDGNFEKISSCITNKSWTNGDQDPWDWLQHSKLTFAVDRLVIPLFHRYRKDGKKKLMK
jgi:hypothetical protein